MTLFPKMETSLVEDKNEKTDNTPTTEGKENKETEEYKVLQLFREIISRFSTDKDEEDQTNDTGAKDAEENDGTESTPSTNSTVPLYDVGSGVGDGQYVLTISDDSNLGMQNETAGNPGNIPSPTYAMPSMLPNKLMHFLKADDGGVSLGCIILNASIMQLIFGVICICLGIAAIVVKIPGYHIGDPIWTGFLFYVITGLIGVLTWRFTKDGLVVSYLVMAILSVLASIQLMALAAFAIGMEVYDERSTVTTEKSIRYQLYVEQIKASNQDGFSKSERLALEILVLFVAFVEMIFVIVMAVVICKLWPTKVTQEKQKDVTDKNKNDFDLKDHNNTEKPAFNEFDNYAV